MKKRRKDAAKIEYIRCAACEQIKPLYSQNAAMCRDCLELMESRRMRNMDLYHMSPHPVAWRSQVKQTVRKAHEDIFK